ncbi:MAG: PAS domain-containing sensor histidine kinase, partial [Candidatus Obscuribacterales bacterium]|nr:PAS domain-containing sensor histidine kinase [Candidatus Obscuribacterales bacterium]
GFMPLENTKAFFNVTEQKIQERLSFIATLVAENPNPGKSLNSLKVTSNRVLHLMESTISQFDNHDLAHADLNKLSAFSAAKAAMVDLLAAARSLVDDQDLSEPVDPKAQEAARNLVRMSILFGVILNIAIAFWLAVFFGKEIATRLKVILDNTKLVAEGKQLNPRLSGSDEIALLDQAFHDMTEKVTEANRKERAAVENALDVICSINSNGEINKINPASTKQWGYAAEQLIGKELNTFISEEDQEITRKFFKAVIDDNSSAPCENRLRRSDGSYIDLRWTAHWSEQEKMLFCIAHDITASKEAERFKQQLLQIVSHDLRTPLASMQHVTDMLLMGVYGELPEAAVESLRISDNSTARLMRLVNDFLDFEKMEAGQLRFKFSKVDVFDILEQSVSAVRAFAEESEIEIDSPNIKMSIEADSDRLVQVLVNLLSNSIKFSPSHSTVTISVNTYDNLVEFRIKDEGPGIPEELRASIFGRFKQIDSGSKNNSKIKGTGLGLSICKGFVEGHNGSIGVESKEGQGSTFWFKVPVLQQQKTD